MILKMTMMILVMKIEMEIENAAEEEEMFRIQALNQKALDMLEKSISIVWARISIYMVCYLCSNCQII